MARDPRGDVPAAASRELIDPLEVAIARGQAVSHELARADIALDVLVEEAALLEHITKYSCAEIVEDPKKIDEVAN